VLARAVEVSDRKPNVLLQASTVGHYGSTGDVLITESSATGDNLLALVTIDWEASA